MWKKTFDAYPDVTFDNWQDPNWKDTDAAKAKQK